MPIAPPHRAQRGFTLIELVVAMAILTVLAGAAIPVFSRGVAREHVATTRAELARLEPAVRAYFEDVDAFPPTFDALVENTDRVAGWTGPYATVLATTSRAPDDVGLETDAWGRAYTVKLIGDSRVEIRSAGPDPDTRADDIVQSVDVTPIRRARTLDELSIVNSAIAAYNATHLPDAPLSTSYPLLLSSLVGGGYLPGGSERFDADGWGDGYVPDPRGASPVVAVTSVNLGPVDEGDDDDSDDDDDDDIDRGDDGRGRGPPDEPPGRGRDAGDDDDRGGPQRPRARVGDGDGSRGRGPPDRR